MAHAKSTDPDIFILPDLGEGVHEAELIAWKVKPGDAVEEHDIVAEMETDKALVEVPSPRDGVIAELFGNPGDILNVGAPAWRYEGGQDSSAKTETPPRARMSSPAQPAPETNGSAPSTSDDHEDAGTVVGSVSGEVAGVTARGGKALAAPAVRRLARDLGVDIDSVTGTGLAGRVTEKDVRAAASQGPARAARVAEPIEAPSRVQATTVTLRQEVVEAPVRTTLIPAANDSIIPMRGVRRKIAQRLRQSVDHAVHFSVMDDADVTKLDEVRRQMGAASGEKLSYLPFVISAVCRALGQFPSFNATVDDEKQEIVRHAKVHMGIAADTDQGLSVPVIADADSMGVLELGREITELARMVRDRSIPRERLVGSTFTISNVGSYAGKYATPIINYPEVGILAVGRVYDGVVSKSGGIHVAKMLPLSLTCDHRSVDGADAARMLAVIIELLSRPEELLTPARV